MNKCKKTNIPQIAYPTRKRKTHELVIELVLSRRSANLARLLIRQWITACLPAEWMQKEIEERLP